MRWLIGVTVAYSSVSLFRIVSCSLLFHVTVSLLLRKLETKMSLLHLQDVRGSVGDKESGTTHTTESMVKKREDHR